jgi:hypothetical protein
MVEEYGPSRIQDECASRMKRSHGGIDLVGKVSTVNASCSVRTKDVGLPYIPAGWWGNVIP